MNNHLSREVHCNTPINIWGPLDTYDDDICCQFYSDVWDIAATIEKDFGAINRERLVEFCGDLKYKYKDIPNFEGALFECCDSFVDLEIFEIE